MHHENISYGIEKEKLASFHKVKQSLWFTFKGQKQDK